MYGSIASPKDQLVFESDEHLEPKSSVTRRRIGFATMLTSLFVVTAVGFRFMSNGFEEEMSIASFNEITDSEKVTCKTDTVVITASNEYGIFSAPYPYLENGEILIEPYKNTTVSVSLDAKHFNSDSMYSIMWTFSRLQEEVDSKKYFGSEFQLTMEKAGTNDVQVDIFSAESGSYICSYETFAYVKYVKRELRALTLADRNDMLDAVATLWKYSDDDGRAKYGSKFVSLQTFVEEHALASNDIMCDQFHEGSGFLTHHLALGNAFEVSVRSVNPAVTIHYWDFTIEGEEIFDAGKNPSYMMEITPFFSDDYFGSVDEDNHIADSRWAHAPMPRAPDTISTRNSFGYIRSYWNNNPDTEISRHLFDACGSEPVHKLIPYCMSHYSVLDSNSMKTFQQISPSDGHGPMHVQVGGMWGGCSDAYANFTTTWSYLLDVNMTDDEISDIGYPSGWKWGNVLPRRYMFETAVMGEHYHFYRALWRSHMCSGDSTPALLVCPESCDAEIQEFDECTCRVDALVQGNTTWQNIYSCVLNTENQEYFNAAFPAQFLEELILLISTSSVLEGEMLESAAPADPIFWFIHSTIERLLSAKRLPGVTNMSGVEFLKWDVADGSNETFYEYSYYSFGAGEKAFYPDGYQCYGHLGSDNVLPSKLPFTDTFIAGADRDGDGIVSNLEFYLSLNPIDPDLNDYVFADFLWDHCNI